MILDAGRPNQDGGSENVSENAQLSPPGSTATVRTATGNAPRRQAVVRMLLAATVGALAGGCVAWLLGARSVADACWAAGAVVAIVPAAWWVLAAWQNFFVLLPAGELSEA